MNTHELTGRALSTAPADFVAELTVAAYRVALRYAADGAWIDLELELWRALTEAANRWNPEAPFRPEYQRGGHESPNV
jgi:hypothetical protein